MQLKTSLTKEKNWKGENLEEVVVVVVEAEVEEEVKEVNLETEEMVVVSELDLVVSQIMVSGAPSLAFQTSFGM